MSLFRMLKRVAAKKLETAAQGKEHRPQRTPVPGGFHQGSVVEVPDLATALARADGSLINDLDHSQQITAVGRYTLFDRAVFNCHLADGASFIRLVTQDDRILESALFVMRDEIIPPTQEDWAFWLGTHYPDGSVEHGLIGWSLFQVDTDPPTVYNRSWAPGEHGVEPVAYTETITDLNGETVRIKHESMEYWRQLGDDPDAIEMIFVTAASSGSDASVDVYVGIPIKPLDFKVFAVN
jgi:hypothetical protein